MGSDELLSGVGTRLRALRQHRDFTLSEIADRTGVSVSTLSRLESGDRRPTLDLLLVLAQLYGVSLDTLVGRAPGTDPRVRGEATRRKGMVFTPLSRHADPMTAFRVTLQVSPKRYRPELKAHPGYDWFYVLSGQVRLLLDQDEYVIATGEAVEFDTLTPHAMVADGAAPAEVLHLVSREGERVHFREL